MSPEKIVLAVDAVADRGWRWLAGMLALDPDPKPWKDIYGVVHTRVDERLIEDGDSEGALAFGGWLPDFDDTATVGCLLALVRAAWKDEYLVVLWLDGGWTWIERPRCREQKKHPRFRTEIEALVAALRSAP